MEEPIITKLEIYDTYEVACQNPEMIQEAISYAVANPRVYDYRGPTYAVRKLEHKQCRVVQGKVAPEDESATCCECGSQLTLVRPGKHQCDTCENNAPEGYGHLGLKVPHELMSAEYSALYELLEDTTETQAEALVVCREIIEHAGKVIDQLKEYLNKKS